MTYRSSMSVLCLLSAVILLLAACSSGSGQSGRSLYEQGLAKEQTGAYISANSLYMQALPLLRKEDDPALVKDARIAVKGLP